MSTTATMNATDTGAALAALDAARSAAATKSTADTQDRFLKLLVAQLKNQDPMNPLDNAQLTSQMAQISTVNGIDKLNATLQEMAAGFGATQSLQAAAMIGRSVLVPGSALELKDGKALGGVELPQAVDSLQVSIRDGSGRVLHKVNLGPQPAGVAAFQWDGVTDSGAPAAPGSYSFVLEAVQGGKKVDARALALGQVLSVTQAGDGVTLNVSGSSAPVVLADVKRVM
jgi:flagellar basal-body rod modification protein FlgD